jgi:hypothetical protein
MKRSWLLAAVAAVGLIAPAAPAAAASVSARHVNVPHVNVPDVPVVTICLTYSRSWCADVAHDRNVSGEPVWIWNARSARDDHWYVVNVPCPMPSCRAVTHTRPNGCSSPTKDLITYAGSLRRST